jgi:hypothetical protein
MLSSMPKEPKPDDVAVHEETDSPSHTDDRNFYKVEKWTRDGTKVDSLLYAGNSLGRARAVFEGAIDKLGIKPRCLRRNRLHGLTHSGVGPWSWTSDYKIARLFWGRLRSIEVRSLNATAVLLAAAFV